MRVRIVSPPAKGLYIAFGIAGVPLTITTAPPLTTRDAASLVVVRCAAFLIGLALMIVAVRSFRRRNEEPEPPRDWWRVTGASRMAAVLGDVYTVVLVTDLVQRITASKIPSRPYFAPLDVTSSIEVAVWAFLSVHCAVRLHRLGVTSAAGPSKPPRFERMV